MDLLEINGVQFAYNKTSNALSDISLKIKTGDVIGLVGSNGAGKTTLLKVINGLLKVKSGSISLNGTTINKTPASKLANKIAYSFQLAGNQFFTPTVKKEILTTLELFYKDSNHHPKKTLSILSELDLVNLQNSHPYNLSGGEQRRLSLAIMLSSPATFILLDEPTANLDAKGLVMLTKVIENSEKNGKAMMIASHDINFLIKVCDRFILLDKGTVIFDGRTTDFLLWISQKNIDFLQLPRDVKILIDLINKKKVEIDTLNEYLTYQRIEEKITFFRKLLNE